MANTEKHHKIRPLPLILLCLFVGVSLLGWWRMQATETVTPTYAYKPTLLPKQNVSLPWPTYGQAAIGASGYGVLASHGEQKPLATASIAKVITALTVLRMRPLQLNQQGPSITITQTDIDSYNRYVSLDGSVVRVSLGEQLTEYQALQALLLPSANNIAETLARWAFGSIDAYNTYANSYVASLGLKSITVTDPSGFLPTTEASAQDLTILGEQAMLSPVIAEIVAQPSASIPVHGTIYNYNLLLGQSDNVGIKTGNNDQDPGAYLFAFREPVGDSNVLIVGTIMGGPDLATVLRDAHTLEQAAIEHFKPITIVRAGQVIATYQHKGQVPVRAVASQDLTLVTWDGLAYQTSVSLRPIKASASAGTNVGYLTVTGGNNHATNSVPVVLKRDLQPQSLSQKFKAAF